MPRSQRAEVLWLRAADDGLAEDINESLVILALACASAAFVSQKALTGTAKQAIHRVPDFVRKHP